MALIVGFLLTGTIIGFAYLTPRDYFSSVEYWLGLITFFLYGMFLLLPSGPIMPIAGKRKKSRGFGYLPIGITALALIVVGKWFPSANDAVFAIPVGLFSGAGLRFAYLLVFQSRWAFCPKCEKKSWILEMDGRWYCNKKGHVVDMVGKSHKPLDGELGKAQTKTSSLEPNQLPD